VIILKQTKSDLSSSALHILAMGLMLCDHLWATIIPGNNWLTCIGRLAFPIFAFMLVEGYFHTRNLKRYALRLLLFAVISEIPFNLMYSSSPFYPFHQNVIWTLFIGLWMIHLNEKAKQSSKLTVIIPTAVGTVLLGSLLGLLSFADYNAAGVLMILVFYFFRGKSRWCILGQLAGMYYINFEMLQGLVFPVTIFGETLEIPQQGLAIFSLPILWLYQGRKGYSSKWFQQLCYWFYPAHMLLLWLIRYLK
jgi:hypothetical protein